MTGMAMTATMILVAVFDTDFPQHKKRFKNALLKAIS
jgi:hypothetical protein